MDLYFMIRKMFSNLKRSITPISYIAFAADFNRTSTCPCQIKTNWEEIFHAEKVAGDVLLVISVQTENNTRRRQSIFKNIIMAYEDGALIRSDQYMLTH